MAQKKVGIGLIGYAFMGKAHSNAYRQVARFFEPEVVPELRAICGRTEANVKAAAEHFGWESYETDYRKLLELWLYFHVPLSFALLAALIAHVVSVFHFW